MPNGTTMNLIIITKKIVNLHIILIVQIKTIVIINNRDTTKTKEITVKDIINKMKTNMSLSFKIEHI